MPLFLNTLRPWPSICLQRLMLTGPSLKPAWAGRLDATNVLSPELCVISNISMEHRFYLGNTIADITAEKGGIIKPNTPVITGVTQKSAIRVLEKIAVEKPVTVIPAGDSVPRKAQKRRHLFLSRHPSPVEKSENRTARKPPDR